MLYKDTEKRLKRENIRRWLPANFKQSESSPLKIFNDGMKKDSVSMKKVLSGTTNILCSKLFERQNQIHCTLVDANERLN